MPQIVVDGVLVDEPEHLTAQREADAAMVNAMPTSVLLIAAQAQQSILANGGVTILLPGSVTVLASTTADGRVDLSGLYTMAISDPSFSTIWVQSTGALTLNASQIIQVGKAVLRFYQSTYQALAETNAAIEAGTITSVDAVRSSASWPATTIDLTAAAAS